MRTLSEAVHFGRVAGEYQRLRQLRPHVRAVTVHRYIQDDHGLTLEQFRCETEIGHQYVNTGSHCDGDDESFGGEGRCYCSLCGADGDA